MGLETNICFSLIIVIKEFFTHKAASIPNAKYLKREIFILASKDKSLTVLIQRNLVQVSNIMKID
jgi:hypothetical protein